MTQDKINSLLIDEELLFFIQNYSSINQKFVKENIDEVDLSDNTYEHYQIAQNQIKKWNFFKE